MSRFLINAVGARMGGAVRHLSGFVDALAAENPGETHTVCISIPSDVVFSAKNVRVIPFTYRAGWLGRLIFDQVIVPWLALRARSDILISLLNFGTLFPFIPQIVFQRNALYYSDWSGKIISPRFWIPDRLRKNLIYWTMRASDAIVTPTEAMRKMVLNAHPSIPAGKILVIPHGFDVEGFLASAESIPEKTAEILQTAPQGRVRVLSVGHPAPYKGVDTLVAALAEIKRDGAKFSFFIPVDVSGGVNERRAVQGYDEAAKEYKRLVSDFGLLEEAVFLGWIPQKAISRIYKASDIFVFPSKCESFGFPMLEAMSAGLPIVAADTETNREILGDAALFYPPGDFSVLAVLLKKMISSPDLRENMSGRSLARLKIFDWGWGRYNASLMNLVEKISPAHEVLKLLR